MAFQRTATKFSVKGGSKKLGTEGGRGEKEKGFSFVGFSQVSLKMTKVPSSNSSKPSQARLLLKTNKFN